MYQIKKIITCIKPHIAVYLCALLVSSPVLADEKPAIFTLPEVLPSDKNSSTSLKAPPSIYIREFVVSGNTVLADDVIKNIITPYTNKSISFASLSRLRDALTLAYVTRGYVNSGATIPKQTLKDGVLHINVIEGKLSRININNDGRLSDSYLRERIALGDDAVVNLKKLEDKLQVLKQNPRIKKLQSNLLPGDTLGQSVLSVNVVEEKPYNVVLELNNYESPNVGAEGLRLGFTHNNVSGHGDSIITEVKKTQGLDALSLRYELPINQSDTSVFVDLTRSESEIIETPFDELGIESEASGVSIGINSPWLRSAAQQLDIFASIDYRRSESFLLGIPFSFSPGVEDGVAKVAVLRVGQNWVRRSPNSIFFLRSVASVGLDTFNATQNDGDTPDGEFAKLELQSQFAYRFSWLKSQLSFRNSIQYSDSGLLGLEKFSIGGYNSVRGYRENSASGDIGASASLEWRIPLWNWGSSNIALTSFADTGYRIDDAKESKSETLSSVGLGLRWNIDDYGSVKIHWADAAQDIERGDNEDLQDEGFHASVTFFF